jgi:hypothetical protein
VTVWKYALEVNDINMIRMPMHSRILCVQAQHDSPGIWALVDPENPLETRTFLVFGTGRRIDYIDPSHYIGTFQLGALVFHVFEMRP